MGGCCHGIDSATHTQVLQGQTQQEPDAFMSSAVGCLIKTRIYFTKMQNSTARRHSNRAFCLLIITEDGLSNVEAG
jgi:hypothetical protein